MSVLDKQVIRQYLSQLLLDDLIAPFLDYRKQKLFTASLLQIFITAQLLNWDSLRTIEEAVRSDDVYQELFELSSITKSQLSRRIQALPVELPQALFAAVAHRLNKVATPAANSKISGLKLALVDSTSLTLPPVMGDWAYVSKKQNSVKLHTRLVIVDEHMAYPDRVVPSTGNVSDYEGSDDLVTDSCALYVMDRGYGCYKRMSQWVVKSIDFVVRLKHNHYVEVLEENELPSEEPRVIRDAVVLFGNQPKTRMEVPLRLIEFVDEKQRFYRLATTRFDLTAVQIMEVYRSRWLIELFFKWMKQHLKFAKLYSYQPEAVWNHIYLALVAYGLNALIKQQMGTSRTSWELLRMLRLYALKSWSAFIDELERKPKGTSKGRQKKGPAPPLQVEALDGIQVRQPRKRKR